MISMISLNLLGSIFFLFLFWSRVNFVFEMGWQGTAYALIILQSGMAGVLIVINAKPIKDAGFKAAIAAWICAVLPLLFRGSGGSAYFVIPGLLLMMWALITLGKSFSVVPDDRGLIQNGPYQLIRHPMYAGELLSYLGICISPLLLQNIFVFLLILSLIVYRIVVEERVVEGYMSYSQSVRWRLVPYVW